MLQGLLDGDVFQLVSLLAAKRAAGAGEDDASYSLSLDGRWSGWG
jgi:hypothetical protein